MNIQIPRSTAARRLLAISAMALLGGSALAQTTGDAPPPPPPLDVQAEGGPRGEPPRLDPQRMAEHRAKRQQALKTSLALSAGQETAWQAWVAATTPSKPPVAPPDMQAERTALAKLTTPERIDRMRALKAQRDAEQTRLEESTKAFYASLTPQQKQVFDAEMLPPPQGPHGPGHGPRKDGKTPEEPRPSTRPATTPTL